MRTIWTIILAALLISLCHAEPAADDARTAIDKKAESDDSVTASESSPEATLIMGRELMKQERWEDAAEKFELINKNKRWLNRDQRAEATYRYAVCLEKVGRIEEASNASRMFMTIYLGNVEWSSQSLEKAFEHAYDTDDTEHKIQAYAFLRRTLYFLQKMREEDAPSGALTRVRKRLPEVIAELNLTPEQVQQIDEDLGLNHGEERTEPKQDKAQQGDGANPPPGLR